MEHGVIALDEFQRDGLIRARGICASNVPMPLLILVVATFCVMAGSIVDCRRSGQASRTGSPADTLVPISANQSAVATGTSKLGFELLSELTRGDTTRNAFISPVSISLALGMTWNGAAESTERQMARVLGIADMTSQNADLGYEQLRKSLQRSDTMVRLNIANSLWLRKGIRFESSFLQQNKRSFGAEVENLDFGDPGAASRINEWVSRNTQGRIKTVLDRTDKSDVVYLVNAVYFIGRWDSPFDSVGPKSFTTANGATKTVPMMVKSGPYPYLRGPGFEAVAVPYGPGRTSMYLFLPDSNSNLAALMKVLASQDWNSWVAKFRPTSGSICMPKFRLECEDDLIGALAALGMTDAFDATRADFRRMTATQPVFISAVIHKTHVVVNETGTEATAATVVRGVGAPRYKFHLFFNRPFLLAFHSRDAGTLLFLGMVRDPSAR